MNTYRVTLRAFGTTGVLVAASLAMLATVSALVAFDGWPRGYGSGTVDSVSVSGSASSQALTVARVRPPAASGLTAGPAPAGFVKAAGGAAGAGTATGFAQGFVKTIGPVGPGTGNGGLSFPGPTPYVLDHPPGECGSSCVPPPCGAACRPQPGPVERVVGAVCGASGSACGVARGTLGVNPPSSGGPPRVTVPQVQVDVPVQAQVHGPVEVPVQAPVTLPGN